MMLCMMEKFVEIAQTVIQRFQDKS